LIIPGLPRCATTSFSQILSQHPQIFLPKIKEPHYFLPEKSSYYMFNRKGEKVPFDKSGFINTKFNFEENYEGFKSGKIYIDGSTLYAVHHQSIDEIFKQKDINPYFIILKKDPFKRAVSHYLYSVSRGEEFRTFEQALNDEINGLYDKWLLGGYLSGSDSNACEEKIEKLWGNAKFISVDIDKDNVFCQEFMDKILSIFNLNDFSFDFSLMANSLTYTDNRIIKEMRIFFKRVRQVNPILMDNKLTRLFFNAFMKLVPVKKDVYQEYDNYRDLYNKLYHLKKIIE